MIQKGVIYTCVKVRSRGQEGNFKVCKRPNVEEQIVFTNCSVRKIIKSGGRDLKTTNDFGELLC